MKMVAPTEAVVTLVTCLGLLACVRLPVRIKFGVLTEAVVALLASVGFLACVSAGAPFDCSSD